MRSKKSYLHFFFILIFSFLCKATHAITINFDDLDPRDLDDYQLRAEYADFGVIFEEGYLIPNIDSFGNGVTGPAVVFTFTGALPTYVSFISNNIDGLKNFIVAKGPNGYEEIIRTEGWIRGMDPEGSTLYIPDQQVALNSDFGISYVRVISQSSPLIDNLIFHHTKKAVPEPHLLLIFIISLIGIFFRRVKLFINK